MSDRLAPRSALRNKYGDIFMALYVEEIPLPPFTKGGRGDLAFSEFLQD
jgi:hypothetical protein